MRLILEKQEILDILGHHFEVKLDPKQVVIRTEPSLEIEVSGIPLTQGSPRNTRGDFTPISDETAADLGAPTISAEEDNRVYGEGASFEPPPAGTDETPPKQVSTEDISPAAILARSKQLERELESNPVEKRRAGRHSSEPPKSFKEEL